MTRRALFAAAHDMQNNFIRKITRANALEKWLTVGERGVNYGKCTSC
jgi:hypothetical protein